MSSKKRADSTSVEEDIVPEGIAIHLKDAFTSANDWKNVSQTFIQNNPVAALVGAFFVGLLLSRVARYA